MNSEVNATGSDVDPVELSPTGVEGSVATSRARRSRRRGPANVLRLLLRWLVGPVATLLVASFIIFMAISFSPGDPVAQLLGRQATQEQHDLIEHKLGLDQPVLERYGHWLSNAVSGDFGDSVILRSSVSSLIEPRLGTTAFLLVYSLILITVFGVGIGVIGGAWPRFGPFVAFLSGLGVAVPPFVAAGLLVSVFALSLSWFPALGSGSGFVDQVWHMTLPAIALSISWVAYVAQITRASVAEERGRDLVDTARGRGLMPWTVIRRHVLRNAAIPIVTILGLTMAGLIASAVVVETAFNLNGLGSLLITSVSSKDLNVVLAISVIIVGMFIIALTLIDLLTYMLDPRIRARAKSGAVGSDDAWG